MTTIKLSVTIVLPGSTMMTSQECEQNPKDNYVSHKMMLSIKHFDKKTKKAFYKREPLEFKTRKCIPAQQVLKMSEEAYDYMISSSCPDWYLMRGGISKWKKLSPKERLELHLDRTCKSLGGISYTYAIFGD